MAKISVIIPVHNGADYITDCINSITNQSIGKENLEIIIVNDASTDNTYEQLMLLEKKYSEILLIINLEQNVGVGAARNIGLIYASANYIGFVDSDDYVEYHMYETLYSKIAHYECDLVVCRAKKHLLDDRFNISMGRTNKDDNFIIINNSEDRKRLLNMNISMAVWNKLYRRELLINNQIYFPEGLIYEDIFFSELVKHYANKIYICEEYLYHYIERKNSLSNNSSDWVKRLHRFWIEEFKLDELKKRDLYDSYKDYYDNEYMITYITIIKNFVNTYGTISVDLLTEINKFVLNRYPDYRTIPINKKILATKSPSFYIFLLDGLNGEIDLDYVKKLIALA